MQSENKLESFKIIEWIKYRILYKLSFGKSRKYFFDKYCKQRDIYREIRSLNSNNSFSRFKNILFADKINENHHLVNKQILSEGKKNDFYSDYVILPNQSSPVSSVKSKNGIKILYIVDYLISSGGVETRLKKLFHYISKKGFKPIIMTSGFQEYKPLQEYINLRLDFYAENFNRLLFDIVEFEGIDIVEFQVKGIKYLKNIDFNRLRKICRTGLHIHGQVDINDIDFQCFDYAIRASSSWGNEIVRKIQHIPNWVQFVGGKWIFDKQDKALFISRLDTEKMPTLKSFINVCNSIGCRFDIAGNISSKNKEKVVRYLKGLDNCNYLGEIDTKDFLDRNINEYLFVGGVGQVAIEAASYGIPFLVCTHLDDYNYSRFIAKRNFDRLVENNFVININRWIPNDSYASVDYFRRCLSDNDFNEFNVLKQIKENISEEVVLPNYIKILENIA